MKGRAWCADLPVVSVEWSRVPKRVTIIVPYYEQPIFFARQLSHWAQYPEHVRQNLSVIVVDDASPEQPMMRAVDAMPPISHARYFRNDVDLRWNWIAARNNAATEAPPGWLLMTDMDHVIPNDTIESAIFGVHRTDTIYGFSRVEHTGPRIAAHPNSWLLTREMFWTVGGYDEELAGHYGTDGDWRRRCAAAAKMAILSDPLVRNEFVDDSSTTRYKRKQPEDAAVSRIIAARKPGWRPKTGSFSYRELFRSTAQEAA